MIKTELYFRHSRAANYSCWASVPKNQLIIAFIVVLDTCKNDENPSRKEKHQSAHNITPIIGLWIFLDIQGQLTP